MYKIVVEFDKAIHPDDQGNFLLVMERLMRDKGLDVCVEKRTMPDDSKLRLKMTDSERAKL